MRIWGIRHALAKYNNLKLVVLIWRGGLRSLGANVYAHLDYNAKLSSASAMESGIGKCTGRVSQVRIVRKLAPFLSNSLLKTGEKSGFFSLKNPGKRKSPHAANPHADWISLSAEGGIRTHAPDTGL